MKQKVCVLAVLIALISIPAFAQYNPAPGSVTLPFDLFSPVFLAGGADSVAGGIPAASALNPAAAGDTQRRTLEVSYIGLIGTVSPDSGWNGHAVNGGFIWPTRAGPKSNLKLVFSVWAKTPIDMTSTITNAVKIFGEIVIA